jgi:hypothetical protein
MSKQVVNNLYIDLNEVLEICCHEENEHDSQQQQPASKEVADILKNACCRHVIRQFMAVRPQSMLYLDFEHIDSSTNISRGHEKHDIHIHTQDTSLTTSLRDHVRQSISGCPDAWKDVRVMFSNAPISVQKSEHSKIVAHIRHSHAHGEESTHHDVGDHTCNKSYVYSNKPNTHSIISRMLFGASSLSITAAHLHHQMHLFPDTPIIFPIPALNLFRHWLKPSQQTDSTRNNATNRNREATSILCRTLLNSFLGLGLAWNIVKYSDILERLAITLWHKGHNEMLRNAISWLESYPLGFKLNIALTACFGAQSRFILDTQNAIVCSTFVSAAGNYAAGGFAVIAGLLGAEAASCVLFDVVSLCTVHVFILLPEVFRRLFRFQRGTLSSLWLLFRGKKKNILRKRNDTMDYDSMQLLVGMFLFCTFVFCFTTFLVYYVFFCMVKVAALVLLTVVWVPIVILHEMPVLKLWHRMVAPNTLCKDIYFVELLEEETSTTGNKEHGLIIGAEDGTYSGGASLKLVLASPMSIVLAAYRPTLQVLNTVWKRLFVQVCSCGRINMRRILLRSILLQDIDPASDMDHH